MLIKMLPATAAAALGYGTQPAVLQHGRE